MKNVFHRFLAFCSLACLFHSLAMDVLAKPYRRPDLKGELKINVKAEPIFPPALLNQGITQGFVSVIVDLSEHAALDDWIIFEATDPLFAREIDKVIEKWEFDPPRINGKTYASVHRININFEASGGVLSLSFLNMDHYLNSIFKNSNRDPFKIRVVEMHELDAIPTPISIEKPLFPAEFLDGAYVRHAVFDFYIDELGHVRIPSLRAAGDKVDERLLVIAQDSLLNWKFEPPTVNGKPVTVHAAQPFSFREKGEEPLSTELP